MTNPTLARLAAAALLFTGGLSFLSAAFAQDSVPGTRDAAAASAGPGAPNAPDARDAPAGAATPAAGAVAPAQPALDDRLGAAVAEIEGARERLAPLIAAVDIAEAESWIAESPVARLGERAQVEGLAETERGLWQQAVAHEEAGAERVRGALNRAALAVNAGNRLSEALGRVETMRGQLPAE